VKISGSDFTGATAVSFGSTPAAAFTVDSDSQVTAVSPAVSRPGKVDVAVTTLAGNNPSGAADAFTYRACRVPNLGGKTLKKAKKRLRKAGCKLGKVRLRRGADRRSGRVTKQRPRAGKLRPPGARVGLTLGRLSIRRAG
jgi:hypothetical protein